MVNMHLEVERAMLTISLPGSMKDHLDRRIKDGHYSTPSEYIRSLIRHDRALNARGELALLLRREMAAEPVRAGERQRQGKRVKNS
jgi:Arc/MetJ-type ribon-helix-helix transcriptional regulator